MRRLPIACGKVSFAFNLALTAAGREEIARLPAFAAPPAEAASTDLAVFDTPTLALRRRGLLVWRAPDGAWRARSRSAGAAFGSPGDWRAADPGEVGARPSRRQVAALAGGDDNLAGLLGRSRSWFVARLATRRHRLALEGRTIAEATFVEGCVEAGRRQRAVSVLAIAVREGPAGPALRQAAALVEHHGARLTPEGVAEAGYRLRRGGAAEPSSAAPSTLPAGVTLDDSVFRSFGGALDQFVSNLPAAGDGMAEGIHQMRVALRRLRTLLVLFSPCLEPFGRRRFNALLRDIAMTLGQARDWDVFLAESLVEAQHDGLRRDSVGLLKAPAERRQREARAQVKALIAGPSPSLLALGLAAWIAEGDWRRGGDERSGLPLDALLPDLLGRIAGRARLRGQGIDGLDEPGLHDLRKTMKKLRYGAEAVRSLYPPGRVDAYLRRCRNLQSALGIINDAAVAPQLIETLVPAGEVAVVPAASAFLAWNQSRAGTARKGLRAAWEEFEGAKPFWR